MKIKKWLYEIKYIGIWGASGNKDIMTDCVLSDRPISEIASRMEEYYKGRHKNSIANSDYPWFKEIYSITKLGRLLVDDDSC